MYRNGYKQFSKLDKGIKLVMKINAIMIVTDSRTARAAYEYVITISEGGRKKDTFICRHHTGVPISRHIC